MAGLMLASKVLLRLSALLLSLLLLTSPSFGFASPPMEYPLDLTCEMGASIVYFHFVEDEKESWLMPHESLTKERNRGVWEMNRKNRVGKKNKLIEDFDVGPMEISFQVNWGRGMQVFYKINRYTLGIATAYSMQDLEGICQLGFIPYDSRKF